MKYTITINASGAMDSGFIDPKFICEYDNFDDVCETGSIEQYMAKAKGYLRFKNIALLIAGVTSWDKMDITQEGGSALVAPTEVKFVGIQFQDETITAEDVKKAVVFGLSHEYKGNCDVWNSKTKTNAQGVKLLPVGFETIFVTAPKLFEEADAENAVTVEME